MKKFFAIALTVLSLAAFASCNGEDKEENASLEGRWNAGRYSDTPDDYAFCLIISGNKMDAYIVAWGEHFEGTYTYSDNEINYNITKASKAWTGVSYDENGNMVSWAWETGNMDQETFELSEGYGWYPMSEEDLADRKEMLSKFKFQIKGDTAASSDLFGIEGLTFHKAE